MHERGMELDRDYKDDEKMNSKPCGYVGLSVTMLKRGWMKS